MILYTNGCSYTANQNVPENLRYPRLLSDQLGWKLVDNSWPGSSNSRIIRTTTRDCLNLKQSSQDKIFAQIQLTHLHRFECPSTGAWTTNNDRIIINDNFVSIKFNQENLPVDIEKYAKLFWKIYNNRAIWTMLLISLIGLISFFKQHDIDYLIYFGPQEKYELQTEDIVLLQELQSDSKILDLLGFSMLETITKSSYHPDIIGNKLIADYFFNLLCEQA